MVSAPFEPATSSPPTGCGARSARRSASTSPATSANGTPSASTSSDVTGPAADRLYVWFEADLLPGYAWSFPLPGNRANVGFGVLRERSRRVGDMKDLWVDLLRRPHIVAALGPGFELEDRHTAWPIPARVDDVTLSHGRTLFVGDAAAATDVMTGEGIGQALLTGRLAAEAILAAGLGRPGGGTRRLRVGRPPPPVRRPRDVARARAACCADPFGARGAVRVSARAVRGAGATSPGGCSRTSRGRSCSRRAAGTDGFSPGLAPTASERRSWLKPG